MKYVSSLRPFMVSRLEELEKADIVVGIPCFNNDRTISHVIRMVSDGLSANYKDLRPLLVISDGGSTDDTREVAQNTSLKPWQEKVVGIY